MKTTLKSFFFFLMLIAFSSANGQSYNSAIGLRFGYPTSVTYKKFLSEKNAVEAYVGYRGYAGYSYISVNLAYQIHNPINSARNLSWYYGAGAGVAFYSYDSGFNGNGSIGIPISGYLGLDYKFEEIPLNLSVDWVPTIFVGGGFLSGFGGSYGALSARYVLSPKN